MTKIHYRNLITRPRITLALAYESNSWSVISQLNEALDKKNKNKQVSNANTPPRQDSNVQNLLKK